MHPHLSEGRLENYLGRHPQCTQRKLNLNLPVFGSPAQYESSALDHASTEAEPTGTRTLISPSSERQSNTIVTRTATEAAGIYKSQRDTPWGNELLYSFGSSSGGGVVEPFVLCLLLLTIMAIISDVQSEIVLSRIRVGVKGQRSHESPRRLHVVILHLIDQRLERLPGHVLNHTSTASLGPTTWQCHQAAMVAGCAKNDF
uniref:Uncharacterized protein n=1 Tax=Timema bartmani TaxID=61472 RepID=A0A7R9F7S3_9NEOP|nr:unnamed protein product [Timema bartmani]